jgi:hypothetical protein
LSISIYPNIVWFRIRRKCGEAGTSLRYQAAHRFRYRPYRSPGSRAVLTEQCPDDTGTRPRCGCSPPASARTVILRQGSNRYAHTIPASRPNITWLKLIWDGVWAPPCHSDQHRLTDRLSGITPSPSERMVRISVVLMRPNGKTFTGKV